MDIDLETNYMGLNLRNPLVISASPVSALVTTLEQLEMAGAAAVVLPSLFEEQLISDDEKSMAGPAISPTVRTSGTHAGPYMTDYNTGPDGYLKRITLAKRSLSIPVIASLNASSRGGWVRFAELMEQAGADALELNIYFVPTAVETTSTEVEDRYLEIIKAVKSVISIPLAVKIGPYFASLPNFANRLSQAGVNGLVLFNRYLEPEIDIDTFSIQPHLDFSTPKELRLPLRWIGILYQQVPLSLAATSGIHDSRDLIKSILVGADVAMVASTLLLNGPQRVTELVSGLTEWLRSKQFSSVGDIRGLLSRKTSAQTTAFERANYLKAISSFNNSFE